MHHWADVDAKHVDRAQQAPTTLTCRRRPFWHLEVAVTTRGQVWQRSPAGPMTLL